MLICLMLMGGIALGATARTVVDSVFSETAAQFDALNGNDYCRDDFIVRNGDSTELLAGNPLAASYDHQNSSDFHVAMTLFNVAKDQEPEGYVLHFFSYSAVDQSWYAEYRPLE